MVVVGVRGLKMEPEDSYGKYWKEKVMFKSTCGSV